MCETNVTVSLSGDNPPRLQASAGTTGRSYLVLRYASAARKDGPTLSDLQNITGWLVPGENLAGFQLDRPLDAGEEIQVSLACPVAFCDAGGSLPDLSAPCLDASSTSATCSVPPYPDPGWAYGVTLQAEAVETKLPLAA